MRQTIWEDLGMSCRAYLALKMSDSSGDLIDNVVGVCFLTASRNVSGKSRAYDESSCLGNLNRRARMYSRWASPADPDMSVRGSWIALLSYPTVGAGCEISGDGGTLTVQNFLPGGMSDATRRKGGRLRVQGRGSHVTLFREDPTSTIWMVLWKL